MGTRSKILNIFKHTGLPYVVWHLARLKESRNTENFLGNLPNLSRQYLTADRETKKKLSERFDRMMDFLVMENGVRKTTYADRHREMVEKVLADPRVRFNTKVLDVLDIPSSTGQSSLSIYAAIAKNFEIRRYVLGDLFFNLYYSEKQNCIFDEEKNLIQVMHEGRCESLYRPYVSGEENGFFSKVFLNSLDTWANKLKSGNIWDSNGNYISIPLIHPEVQVAIANKKFEQRTMDVFKSIDDRFDLIFSFNLLQRNYFSVAKIELGMSNLSQCLNESGVLIVGDTVSFSVYQKTQSKMTLLWNTGRF